MKAVVATFNQEKAQVGTFSVITNLRMDLFKALVCSSHLLACSTSTSLWIVLLDTNIAFLSLQLQGLLVEESSEIASARVSSIYRKSFCRRTNKNLSLSRCKKQTSLSKISEENSDNAYSRSDNQNFNEGRRVNDKELFSDKANTSSTSDNSNTENENEIKGEVMESLDAKTSSVSRFVPEIMNRYRVTIV